MQEIKLWRFISRYKFNSIFVRNFILILLMLILPFSLISVWVYNVYYNVFTEQTKEYNLSSLNKIKDDVQSMILDSQKVALYLAEDSELEKFLAYETVDASKFYIRNTIDNINKTTKLYQVSTKFIDSIYIYSPKSKYLLTSIGYNGHIDNFNDKNWLGLLSHSNDSSFQIASRIENAKAYSDENRNLLTIFMKSPYMNKNENSGIIAINIDIKSFNKPEKGNVFIYDKSGIVLISSNLNDVGKNIDEIYDENNLKLKQDVSIKSLLDTEYEDNGLSYILDYDNEEYINKIKTLKRVILLVGFLAIIISALISFLMARRFFKPIQRIMDAIQTDYNDDNTLKKADEENYILKNIHQSGARMKEVEEELAFRMTMLKKMQNVALQAQINPHFIYNTLDTINWLALTMMNGENEVSNIVAKFSKLMRLTIQSNGGFVLIEKEIEHAKMYLDIQKVRYKDKFTVEWDIDDKVLNLKTIKLILQPVLENAIYHGIKPQKTNGLIRITATLDQEEVIIIIQDKGIGMSYDTVLELTKTLSNPIVKEDEHIGLANVNSRIKTVFGMQYGIELTSEKGKGTKVTIRLPKITQEE